MRRISITKLFAMLPHSANTSFALSHAEPSPFTTLPALYLRLESTRHLSIEMVHGVKNQEILTIDVRATDLEFSFEDCQNIRRLINGIQKEWKLPLIARPIVISFLTHLHQMGREQIAKAKDLQTLIDKEPRETAASWFNH